MLNHQSANIKSLGWFVCFYTTNKLLQDLIDSFYTAQLNCSNQVNGPEFILTKPKMLGVKAPWMSYLWILNQVAKNIWHLICTCASCRQTLYITGSGNQITVETFLNHLKIQLPCIFWTKCFLELSSSPCWAVSLCFQVHHLPQDWGDQEQSEPCLAAIYHPCTSTL